MKKILLAFKKIGIFVRRLPRSVAVRPFASFLGLFLVALILSAFVFYRYSFSIQKITIEPKMSETEFRQELFQKLLQEWGKRALKFEEATTKNYPDIFRP